MPSYKFNEKIGWPKEVNDHVNQILDSHENKPLAFSKHVNEQAALAKGRQSNTVGLHGLHPDDIPNLNRKFPSRQNGWKPVEVEHDGNKVTKLVMRGPYSKTHDAVMPIIPSQNNQSPFAKTLWVNEKNDNHKTLDLNAIHSQEEFQMGKSPRRRLATVDEVRAPGYKPVSHDNLRARQFILNNYLHPKIKDTNI